MCAIYLAANRLRSTGLYDSLKRRLQSNVMKHKWSEMGGVRKIDSVFFSED